jgi:hypothetical protein
MRNSDTTSLRVSYGLRTINDLSVAPSHHAHHLVFLGENPAPTVEDVATQTRETYAGPLAIGEDLMSFEIDDSVTIHRGQQ